jgi:guanylate kinase
VATARRGVPIVVSAPSGGGKTTLCHKLIAELGGVEFSVSHTTRPPRGAERHDVDYHFVADAEFDELIKRDAFLEWAPVHGNRYGTSRIEADSRLERGIDVLFDIDIQGGRQISQHLADTVLVFILPPSLATLEQRLRLRRSDSPEVIERRLAAARQEIRDAAFYTHWIVNAELERAVAELKAIVVAERLRRADKNALVETILDGGSLV